MIKLQGIQIFFKRIFHQSSIDSIFDIEDIFSINKGVCTFKVCSRKRLQSLKKLFLYGYSITH